MPQPIQRVPRGLADVLSIFGGQSPQALTDQVAGAIDLLQFYGLNQRTTISSAGVAAQGARTGPTPLTSWAVLYAAAAQVSLTGTLTSAAVALEIQRGTSAVRQIFSFASYPGPFGAGAIPGVFMSVYTPAYPLLLPPGTQISCLLQQLGTDANANVAVTAEIGLLG